MTTALRPIIGTSDTFLPREKKFFVAHWLDTLNRKERPATADSNSFLLCQQPSCSAMVQPDGR